MTDKKKSKEIKELLTIAADANLEGLDFLATFTFEQLCDGYNGIGPEFLKPDVREKVSSHLSLFEPAALVHDMRYSNGDGSRYRFNYANWEFQVNCRKIAKRAYPWYSWRRYRALAVAYALYDFVSGPGGWKAWQDCQEKGRK